MKASLGIIAAAVLTSNAVLAADLSPMPPAPVFTWTGFYIGVQGGYAWGTTSGPFTNADGTDPSPYSADTSGGFGGGHVGYNWQTGTLVLGLEGDANFMSLEGKDSVKDPEYSDLYTIQAKQSYSADIRGRVGWAVMDRILLYAAGGVAFGDVKTSYDEVGVPPEPYLSVTTQRVGWTIGAGIEYAMTDHLLARVEYRYTDLGTKSFSNPASDIDTADRVKFTSNAVLVGLTYKF